MEAMKLSLAAMANELGHSMQDAISDTGMFQEMLDKSFDKLSRIDDEGFSLENTMGILPDWVTSDGHLFGETQSRSSSNLSGAAREGLPRIAATVKGAFGVAQTKHLGIVHHLVKLLIHLEQLHDAEGSQLVGEVLQPLVVVAGNMKHLLHHLHAAG